jgi:hypothetical protein
MSMRGSERGTEERRGAMRNAALLAAAGLAVLVGILAAPGCSTRSDSPTLAADSTRVYVSRIPGDVDATIGLSLKDSDRRAEEKRLSRERAKTLRESVQEGTRELAKLEKERERRASAPKAADDDDRPRKKKASSKAKSGGEKKAKKSKARAAEGGAYASLSDAALSDSILAIEGRVAAAKDSLEAIDRRSDPGEERSFEIEEGAKVAASVRLENPWGRGRRPLLLHFLWIDPHGKAAFRKAVEYTQNDTLNVLTSSFGISPTKREAGRYNFQVYLFRELIAEKDFELTGVGLTPSGAGDEGGGM